jgi:hypothetical protein
MARSGLAAASSRLLPDSFPMPMSKLIFLLFELVVGERN